MRRINSRISSFETLEEYNRYTISKYGFLSNPIISENKEMFPVSTFSKENGYSMYALSIHSAEMVQVDNLYIATIIEPSIFREKDKGFFLSILNSRRDHIINDTHSIHLQDGYLMVVLTTNAFSKLEIGMLIDNDYNNRESGPLGPSYLTRISKSDKPMP